ncbi:hypothetical protein B0H13DRAFT_2339809 [Mycena leptocephala]|nr:hypothetical protein B0H13DRAFT_2339809 [Mycena leptocephala]
MIVYIHANDCDYAVRIVCFDCGALDVEIQSLGITHIPILLAMREDSRYSIPSPTRLHLALSPGEMLERFRAIMLMCNTRTTYQRIPILPQHPFTHFVDVGRWRLTPPDQDRR